MTIRVRDDESIIGLREGRVPALVATLRGVVNTIQNYRSRCSGHFDLRQAKDNSARTKQTKFRLYKNRVGIARKFR